METLRIIINADDLGATSEINKATFDLVEKGLVTSVTIIANGPDVEEACLEVERHSGCSYGVHLNLTEFSPLSGHDGLKPLLDDNGFFVRERIRQTPIDSALSAGIYEEFCAQIDRVQSLGVSIGHIDSHEHIHTMPRIFPVLKKIQKRYRIRKVRLSRNIYSPGEPISLALRVKKTAYNTLLRRYYRTHTTDGFSDFLSFYESAMVETPTGKTVEVMVHPGNLHYSNEEIDLVQTQWRHSLGRPVEFINYSDI